MYEGVGSYSVITEPAHGMLSYQTASITPLASCLTGEISALKVFYQWTDDAPVAGIRQDSFSIEFTSPSGNVAVDVNFTATLDAAQPYKACICYVGGQSMGDPINIGIGNLYEQITDYATVGANQLALTRYYNSGPSPTTFATSWGSHWRSNYDRYLRIVSASSVSAERADGQILNFSLTSGIWTSDTDVDLKLTQAGSVWTLIDGNDTVESYANVNATEAHLTSIQARNGYSQNLQYNSSNQLLTVTDSYNRTLTLTYQNGLVRTLATPDNLTFTYAFNSSGVTAGVLDRLASVSDSTNPITTQSYIYDNPNQPFALTGITDENGNRYATWTYDQYGRGLTSQHGMGADLTTIVYNDQDNSRTVTNALGEQQVYRFSILQGVPKVTEIDRLATASLPKATRAFTYDASGYVASQTDWNGNLTTYVNDIHGQPTGINEAVGTPQARATTITYHPTFHLPTQIVTAGLTTDLVYDSSGNLLTQTATDTTSTSAPYPTNGTKRTWTFTWSNFLLSSATGPRTDVSELTKFTYDNSGALTAVTNALGQATELTAHSPGGLPQTIVDSNNVTTHLTYDERLRLVSSALTTAAGVLTTEYAYDPAGNLLSATLPDGSALSNTYDNAHRLTGVADLFNQKIAYTLDALGNRTQTGVLNGSGTAQLQRTAKFDPLGRVLQDIGGAGQITSYSYDANGNATGVTDPLGRTTQQAFDALNRLVNITDAANGITTSSYDLHDRPTSVTDPNGGATTYVYDGFGDMIQQTSPVSGTTVYRYDLAGNLAQKVDSRGIIANYSYDALDRRIAVTYPGGAAENVSYSYDQAGHGFGAGRLTSVTDAAGTLSRSYDERGNLLSESRVHGAVTLQTSYTYDAARRITSITYPSGRTVAYARDTMGRVTAVTTKAAGASSTTAVLSKIGYQPFGPVNAQTFGNGVAETRSFDLDYRLTTLAGAGTKSVQNLTYGYDAANNVLSIADAVTSANSQTFGYDALNRLVKAAGVYGSLGYSYDANGNRLIETSPASTALDGLGSVTALTYNQAGRLESVAAGSQALTQYTYDGFGHRLVKVGSVTASTLFQYDTGGRLLEESDGQGNAQVDYVYLGRRPIASIAPSTGKLYFLHDDRLGTPQAATDSNQALAWAANYQPFGALYPPGSQPVLIPQDLRLPGQESDLETGLYHNGFRDYVPGWGRYAEGDPIGLAGGLNTYEYVRSNPVLYRDPLGLVNPILTGVYSSDPTTADTIWNAVVAGWNGVVAEDQKLMAQTHNSLSLLFGEPMADRIELALDFANLGHAIYDLREGSLATEPALVAVYVIAEGERYLLDLSAGLLATGKSLVAQFASDKCDDPAKWIPGAVEGGYPGQGGKLEPPAGPEFQPPPSMQPRYGTQR